MLLECVSTGMHVSICKSGYIRPEGISILGESVLPEGIRSRAEFGTEFSKEYRHSAMLKSVLVKLG